jgi:Pyruvate/2-oxoacid:ferredoxin oxidoreductase delta subunit
LKTHSQMVFTLAVKNLFGAVIGTDKASWHLRAGRDTDTFATVLVQIYDKIRPVVSIVDGVLAMEGNGPNSGDPRPVGIIGASADAVALDTIICGLLGFDADILKTCIIGNSLGVGTSDPEQIRLVGDNLKEFPVRDFKMPKSATITWNFSYWNPIRRFMENHVITKPEIDQSACRNCGICVSHCPPGAMAEDSGTIVIDRKKCISCFCCHELCSNRAVRIVQPFFGKFLSLMSR